MNTNTARAILRRAALGQTSFTIGGMAYEIVDDEVRWTTAGKAQSIRLDLIPDQRSSKVSEAQRRASKRYYQKNKSSLSAAYQHISASVKTDAASAFREACDSRGETPNAVINRLIRLYTEGKID